ncbi:MAG: hypothetical protein GF364_00785 [Candidatus Lokiarchaeota archaeon]|nr:hypothetical protein [Candidatus Lokiarchaeota archaeon]
MELVYHFNEIGLDYIDVIILVITVICSFLFTNWLYPKYIAFAKKKGWVGNDIHKHDRPEVAESGGIPFLIGIIPSCVVVILLFPNIRNEAICFLFTVVFSGLIGYIDDRWVLSSTKKILIMIITGIPIFVLNWFDFIEIDSPMLPILGQLRLTIIYPFVIPLIIAILTNLVNMLEGYNGEGSGSALIAIIFLLICSIIYKSSEGLIFCLVILGALVAFVKFNIFPAKVFPGDVGTLALGAAIGCVAVFGSLEVAMFCCILVHLFNGFYVIASIKGLKERRDIETTDIIMRDDDVIEASKGREDHLTLPRLILADKPLTEPQLVHNFWALAYIGGIIAIIGEVIKFYNPLKVLDFTSTLVICLVLIGLALPVVIKFKAIRGIVYFMIALLLIGVLFLLIIDSFVVDHPLNWLITFVLAGGGFFYWYYLTVKYFWYKISKISGEKYEIKLIPFAIQTVKDILAKFLKIAFS